MHYPAIQRHLHLGCGEGLFSSLVTFHTDLLPGAAHVLNRDAVQRTEVAGSAAQGKKESKRR